jgi:hypothetical protein
MATLPYPTTTDIAVQSSITGQVDYLQFEGSMLAKSDAVSYAGAGWDVVAQGDYGGPAGEDLVLQNQSSGFLDILQLDASGQLVGSEMSNGAVAHVVGNGSFTGRVSGQVGPTLVSQLPDGELDMLAFNASGTLIHSDMVQNTMGLAPAVGVAEGLNSFSPFAGTGGGANDGVILQLASGVIDDVGLSGGFTSGTLAFTTSFIPFQSAGMAPVQAVNQEIGPSPGDDGNENIGGINGTGNVQTEGVQLVTQFADGGFEHVFVDSGYGDAVNEGTIYASNNLNLNLPEWRAVDAGAIAREVLPIT